MKVVLATDHAGFLHKEAIRNFLNDEGVETIDLGAHEYDPDDDYPGIIASAAYEVSIDPGGTRGIILGGSGQGEAIVANRFKNVRAVVYYGDPEQKKDTSFLSIIGGGEDKNDEFEIIKLSREHNDSNILSLGAGFLSAEEALLAVSVWLSTEYEGDERHERRIMQIEELFENDNNNEDQI